MTLREDMDNKKNFQTKLRRVLLYIYYSRLLERLYGITTVFIVFSLNFMSNCNLLNMYTNFLRVLWVHLKLLVVIWFKLAIPMWSPKWFNSGQDLAVPNRYVQQTTLGGKSRRGIISWHNFRDGIPPAIYQRREGNRRS